MTAERPAAPFRILVVCTGNICRSPFAAALLDAALGRVAIALRSADWTEQVEVVSAGTVAMVNWPMEPQMRELLPGYGALEGLHTARQLHRDLVADAGLVLGVSREHRREIVSVLPSASRRVFALNEFTRLLENALLEGVLTVDPTAPAVEAMEAITEAAASRRGFALAPDTPEVDDVVDPYGRDAATYTASASQIAAIVERIEAAFLVAAGVMR